MCSPQTTLSLFAFAASMAPLRVSSQSGSLPSQVKSSPSAPALMAASALPASVLLSSTTSAAARGFISERFLPKKPMPPPLCARRACVNMSNNLLISFDYSLSFHGTIHSLPCVFIDARQLVCLLYYILLAVGVMVCQG